MATVAEVHANYPVASWKVGDLLLRFPVVEIHEAGGNRIVQRERPYRDGAKLDDTGSKAKIWHLKVLFENSIEEEGLVNEIGFLYPDVLNQMIISFDIHETGDLVVPTIGKQRVRAEAYSRVESVDPADAAMVEFTFVEDNEDKVDFRSISAPTVSANAVRQSEATEFDLTSASSADQSVVRLSRAMSNLETLANSPTTLLSEITDEAFEVQEAARRARQIFSLPGERARNGLRFARGNRSERQIARSVDMAMRATNDAREGRPEIIRLVVGRPTSLMAIAGVLQQSFEDLLQINVLPDALSIPAGAVVRVFANTGALQQQGKVPQ